MDFTQGFYQIGLNPITAYLTAFITFVCIYEFTRVPFGPKDAPSWYQSVKYMSTTVLYMVKHKNSFSKNSLNASEKSKLEEHQKSVN